MTVSRLTRTGHRPLRATAPNGRVTPRVRASHPVDQNALAPRVASRVRALRAERIQRDAEQQRKEWVHERRELIASVSHELRTPLTSVVGYSEMLLSGDAGALNGEQTMMLERVADSGGRLLEMIEELMRATSECLAEEEAVDMADAVVDVCTVTSRRAPRLHAVGPLPRLDG
jgi:signal transduction histidine kinase